MTSFLDLPLELRYQVYFYIAIPRYTYFSTYHGLYLSCHQVRNEMNQECGSILQKHLDLIGDSLPVGTIKFDPSVYAKQRVQMSLDFLFTGAKLNTPDPGFLKVCELYFALIEVKLLLEDFSLGDTLRVISLIGGLVRRKVVNAGCITLEASAPYRIRMSLNVKLTQVIGTADTGDERTANREMPGSWDCGGGEGSFRRQRV
ncbi:hypothetical protein HBH70_108280 [Parastagonospora nodorum]|nr:hypothetical protein HBI80_082780 [Parastagonospora nodorum]KAH5137693.1 hypothetical protein HBH70_108280 [Parastagonospora nodorum]KAH5475213.1 hypothetical protein HBI28_105070 [Parastagonospora nodorum]KAH5650096.1 hypothetical protein HBI22_004460 [Parastagonospora nodorum]KAH5729340.1 hypothetical protein HBI20_053780 [Parastagonospora nodorum]